MKITKTILHCDVCRNEITQTVSFYDEVGGLPYKIQLLRSKETSNINDICLECSKKLKEFLYSLNTDNKSNH